MPDAIVGALLLAGAVALAACGLAWLALAMDTHWQQVRGTDVLARGVQRTLRALGAAALLASLLVCLHADHATMAPLVWVMALAAGAALVAFALAWRPRVLAPLVAWLPTGREQPEPFAASKGGR